MLSLERYLKVLEEIGDFLFEIEVFNWGESMLHPQITEFVAPPARGGFPLA